MDRAQAIHFLKTEPYKLAHLLGFTKLNELNNEWIVMMAFGTVEVPLKDDATLLAHRGSYKTTCVSFAIALIIFLFPRQRIMFIRKTETDVKEIVRQVKNILLSKHMQYFSQVIYGVEIVFTKETELEISTNLSQDTKGTSQFLGIGITGSLTGKHYDRIFTDDIVNLKDRLYPAEREKTKIVYQELHNVKNRGGRIFNTGTPWHKDDAFQLMPPAMKYTCYQTGLISLEEIEYIKQRMVASLFAANYLLKHIASEDVIFSDPITGADTYLAEQGIGHIDAAYDGEDYTAYTCCHKKSGKFYILGKLWHKHVDKCLKEIIAIHGEMNGGVIYCEKNADKGYLRRDLEAMEVYAENYNEKMNKYIKIVSYMKKAWEDGKIIFVEGTDQAYIDQICEFNENAEHDDAPDSCASAVRQLWDEDDEEEYMSIYMM